ncbi:hypothetical protein GCM10009730_25360 [Streptomyces albidochromogenes]
MSDLAATRPQATKKAAPTGRADDSDSSSRSGGGANEEMQ